MNIEQRLADAVERARTWIDMAAGDFWQARSGTADADEKRHRYNAIITRYGDLRTLQGKYEMRPVQRYAPLDAEIEAALAQEKWAELTEPRCAICHRPFTSTHVCGAGMA